MISIKTLTKQEYEKDSKSPSEIVFYRLEKDLCEIISSHLAKNIKENIEILQKLLYLRNAEVYEMKDEKRLLYIVKLQ
jgi:hypothetical protein